MKTLISLSTAGLLLLGLAISTPAEAQEKPKDRTTLNGNGNQGKVRPNFVDENNDGICDNQGEGTPIRDRKRLRDGSCGQTPAPAGTQTQTGGGRGQRGGRK